MTDPLLNPQTGHGVECLCDECMRGILAAVYGEEPKPIEGPRIIKCVMSDCISTKDGLS